MRSLCSCIQSYLSSQCLLQSGTKSTLNSRSARLSNTYTTFSSVSAGQQKVWHGIHSYYLSYAQISVTDFCGEGCQSNCHPPAQQSCGADQQSALQRRIGYYEVLGTLALMQIALHCKS